MVLPQYIKISYDVSSKKKFLRMEDIQGHLASIKLYLYI